MYENRTPKNIYTDKDLKPLITERIVRASLIVRGEFLDSFCEIDEVRGDLGFSESSISSLGTLRRVRGSLWFSCTHSIPKIRSLGNLERVDGDVSLKYTDVNDLGGLNYVGGTLNLRDCPVESVGSLRFVGGNLYLSKMLENRIDLSKVQVKGNIRYWKDNTRRNRLPDISDELLDSQIEVPYWKQEYIFPRTMALTTGGIAAATDEQVSFFNYFKRSFLEGKYLNVKGNSNYYFVLMFDIFDMYPVEYNLQGLRKALSTIDRLYPKTSSYAKDLIRKAEEMSGDYESAWLTLFSSTAYISIPEIWRYQQLLNRSLFDGELITRIAGYSHLTSFGTRNIDQIKGFVPAHFGAFETKYEKDFLDCFLKSSAMNGDRIILEFFKSDYYSQFFDSPSEFTYWKDLDREQKRLKLKKTMTHTPEKAIFSQLRRFLRNAEDSFRERIGMPKVGEGWISETELYYKIKTYFENFDVIHQGRPAWLGNQSLDVYLPTYNIGIEYQGSQHYRPVEMFGGLSGFETSLGRDRRKFDLCRQNGCGLIYVYEGYDFDEVRYAIELLIKRKRNKFGCHHINQPDEAKKHLNFE